MDKKITVAAILKTKFIKPINEARLTWLETLPSINTDKEDYESILSNLKAGLIIFESNREVNTTNTNEKNTTTQTSKCGQQLKQSIKQNDFNVISKSKDEMPAIDSYSSASLSLSRKVAADMAEHILNQVHNFIETKRGPTDYREKQCTNNDTSSPPAKSRRTSRKQSAVNAHESSNINQDKVEISDKNVHNQNFAKNCKLSIMLNRLEAQEIDKLLIEKNRKTIKKNRGVCFGNAARGKSLEIIKTGTVSNKLNNMHNVDLDCRGNEPRNKTNTDTAISTIEEETPKFEVGHFETAHRFTIVRRSCPSIPQQKTDFYSNKDHGALKLDNNLVKLKDGDECTNEATVQGSEIETAQTEPLNNNGIITKNTRTNNLRVNENQTNIEQEDYNENKTLDNSQNDLRSIRSRTKVIKKEVAKSKVSEKAVENNNGYDKNAIELENEIHTINWGSRTKTIRKHSIYKNNEDKENINLKEKVSNCILPESREEIGKIQKYNKNLILHKLSASGKGGIVKKQNLQIKNINCEADQLAEKRITRATRNGPKNKNLLLTAGIQNTKQSCNVPCIKTPSISKSQPPVKVCRTPLASYNRITPGTNSATHKNQGESMSVVRVKRHLAEEAEKKIREQEKAKHKANDEIAKKMKEKTPRATAQEARRKREKLQKVAAAKEAAENEKANLAEKAKREKEEKIIEISTRKEKQTDNLKKRLIMQPKKSEQEERSKKEEAACLAKLKKLEEDDNKRIAKKEREQKMVSTQHTVTNAEIEKAMHQAVSVGKLSGVNCKFKQQEGTAARGNSNIIQREVQSYDVTADCDERELLKPKTEHDYGIDDVLPEDSSDDESHPKKAVPLWAQSQNRDYLSSVNYFLSKRIWGLFMEADACPDIKKIFASNPIRKRTSSAIWEQPTNNI